jgi:NTP pyrophosphatase (non-canonical NTP hydrolase)
MASKHELKEIQTVIREFCKPRGWGGEAPNALLMSLVIEVAELGEHFQWKTRWPKLSKDEKKSVRYEIVDVLFYLLRIAEECDIYDMGALFYEKLDKLAIKFPAGASSDEYKKIRAEYRKTGKNNLYD